MIIEKKKGLDEIPFENGSYDPSYIYEAKFRGEWKYSRIIDVKPLDEY